MSPKMLKKLADLSVEEKTEDDEYRNGQIDLAREILTDIAEPLSDEPPF